MKNISLAHLSNDISSTKEYSNAMNTYFNQNTPSSINLNHLSKINKLNKKKNCEDLSKTKINFRNNPPKSISGYKKSPNKKIKFNSVKSFSSKPTKYFSEFQKKTKMKIIELNSNSNTNRNNTYKDKYIYNSLNPTLYDGKMTPRIINTQSNNNTSIKKRLSAINYIPMSRSSKNFFSNSQGFSCFSKSFHKNFKSNKNSGHRGGNSLNNLQKFNKSSLSLRNSKKNSTSNSYRNYNNYLSPTNNQYLGIDLNLVSNSSHRKNEVINSQMQRYLKNYNYNNDDEDYDNKEEDDIDYNLKSNDKYFFPKHSENNEKQDNNNQEYIIIDNNIEENKNRLDNLRNKSFDKEINENKITNLTINKDISAITSSQKDEEKTNKKNNHLKKRGLNQFINRPPLSKKIRKEDFNISLTNIRAIPHLDNNSINQIQNTPISSFHMCPYEAESSPTNYIKSNSNTHNLTYNTNNNSKRNNRNNNSNIISIIKEQSEVISYHSINKSKDDDEEQLKSYSRFHFNQSELTNNNISLNYKIPEKEEEKRITEKIEQNHKLKYGGGSENKIDKKNETKNSNIDAIPNAIEEKDDESQYLDKINSNLISKEKDKKKNNSDFIQKSQDFNNDKNKNENFIFDIETNIDLDKDEKNNINNINNKEIKNDIIDAEENEDKEIMARLERLRKEKEKIEAIDMEQEKLRRQLEEEKIKKKIEEEKIKILKIKEEEEMKKIIQKEEEEKIKMIKDEEEKKIKELERIKEQIKNEQKQRINLEKEAELLEIKIRNNNIKENKNNYMLINSPNIIDTNTSKSYKNNNLHFNYDLPPKRIENSNNNNNKLELNNNNDLEIKSLNNKEDIKKNKLYINNPINSTKHKKKYIVDGLKSSSNNYYYDYGSNSNMVNEIFTSNIIMNRNNNINNNFNKSNIDYYKKIIPKGKEKNEIEDNNISNIKNNSPEKKDNIIDNIQNNNKSFCRSNSQKQFQIEIISKENKQNKPNKNNSFNSFNLKINNNVKPNIKNIKQSLINELKENSIELNTNKDTKNENTTNIINNINNNNSNNNSIISQRLIGKINKIKTKNVSIQYKNNNNINNNKNNSNINNDINN